MKKFKGKLGIICAAGLVCCACGKTDSGNGGALTGNADATAVEAEENIYTLSEIEYEKPKGANIDYLCQNDAGIYGLQSVYSDDAPATYSIVAISGEEAGKEIILETDEGAWFNSLAVDN